MWVPSINLRAGTVLAETIPGPIRCPGVERDFATLVIELTNFWGEQSPCRPKRGMQNPILSASGGSKTEEVLAQNLQEWEGRLRDRLVDIFADIGHLLDDGRCE